jgi:hypothetical protein
MLPTEHHKPNNKEAVQPFGAAPVPGEHHSPGTGFTNEHYQAEKPIPIPPRCQRSPVFQAA